VRAILVALNLLAVGETGANGHRTTTPSDELCFARLLEAVRPIRKLGSRSRPSLLGASGLEVAGCLVVAYDAILRAADRPSTFRTGLAM